MSKELSILDLVIDYLPKLPYGRPYAELLYFFDANSYEEYLVKLDIDGMKGSPSFSKEDFEEFHYVKPA